eukprot:CAMPEP_0183530870 /NCGR_PEP_ID=MMETSP0371-20130417/24415_1 /TAXON_ID=268820 /ORGANISM="Peridinium aciculiferum, Strain PAER-2" /LENGTH=145 /DNA_ID=CAMNT_0025730819 /DNA_START=143 /DNA_END=579 /DNA_ORIENTATION=-
MKVSPNEYVIEKQTNRSHRTFSMAHRFAKRWGMLTSCQESCTKGTRPSQPVSTMRPKTSYSHPSQLMETASGTLPAADWTSESKALASRKLTVDGLTPCRGVPLTRALAVVAPDDEGGLAVGVGDPDLREDHVWVASELVLQIME